MAAIDSIELRLNTFDEDGAGTHGKVYLGICGREFLVRSVEEDFEPGGGFTYIYGEGSTIEPPFDEWADPREHDLQTEDIERFPVYIRFQPDSGDDNWKVGRATVTFNGRLSPQWDSHELFAFTRGIWLGTYRGLVVHLPLQER